MILACNVGRTKTLLALFEIKVNQFNKAKKRTSYDYAMK